MNTITIYRVMCDEYTDTRMGGSNPSYQIGQTCSTLSDCKVEIEKFLKKHGRKKGVDYQKFDIENANWSFDFCPWIMSIKSEKVKI
jgi:hypothetical protein